MPVFATGASVVASLVTAPVDPDHLDSFYRQVRPPGFWGSVARRCDIDPGIGRAYLGRGLAATFLAAGSVFALIVGFGTLVIAAPGPQWLPRPVWVSLCIGVGVGLIPAWWYYAKRQVAAEDAGP